MRTSKLLRGLGAVALVSGMSLTVAPTASAEPLATQTIAFKCSMPNFGPTADFDYDATIDFTSSGPTDLQASLSDLPGVVPAFLSLSKQDVTASVTVKVDDEEIKLSANGQTDVNPSNNGSKEPVALPNPFVGAPTALGGDSEVMVKTFEFNVAGVGGACAAPGEAVPTPEPTPTETPEPTEDPTPEPTDEPKGDVQGSPAEGTIDYACLLSAPFNTEFDYKAGISVSGARADAGDSKVNLAATFTEIPGLAPVPITDGKMRIKVDGTVDGKAVSFTGNSTVNAPANGTVPVPRLSATVETDADEAEVLIDTFYFEFDELAGLEISAECEAKDNVLGNMTIGVGDLPGGDTPPGGDTTPGTTAGATLPRTGGGDAMPVITLWALALGMAGAGLLVWMPRRVRES